MEFTCYCLTFLTGFFSVAINGSPLYFGSNSSVLLNSTTNLATNGFSFSFRTCQAGLLLQQGKNFRLSLEQSSISNHSFIHISFNGSQYNQLLKPSFSLDANSLVRVSLDTTNTSYLQVSGFELLNITLDKSIKFVINNDHILVGSGGFRGCLYSGKNIDLSRAVSRSSVTNGCPLEDERPCPNKVCPAGFTGRNCDRNIDDCASFPCHSYSTCIDQINGFRCVCGPRWTGSTCSTFLGSLCTNSTCQNGGVCKESEDRNNFTCVCPSGYTGRFCEVRKQPCNPNPCGNGGTCMNIKEGSQETFNCKCASGFTGIRCEHNINDCGSHPCTHGTCIDGINNFTCNCNSSGYTGRTCSEDINECDVLQPCQNNGTCRNYFGGYECSCSNGLTGKNCETDIAECKASANPCQNNGKCVEQFGNFSCVCPSGYTGHICDVNIDDCASASICGNGTCLDGINNYTCRCAAGFTGRNCEININECSSSPCLNGGTCIDGINGYTCNCLPSYTGANCSNFTNPCLSSPCQNNGTCLNDTLKGFHCDCSNTSFGGDRCQFKLGKCFPVNPCVNGNCSDNGNSYNCTCQPGYTGVNCSQDINECLSKPCQNSGNCMNTAGSYKCNCNEYTTGVHCEQDIDECKKSVCKNGGRCYNRLYDGFDCACHGTGHEGRTCERRIFPCKNEEGRLGRNPCNNGTCQDGLLNFTCSCHPGYKGDRCLIEINECDFSFCKNNATCIDLINDYNCSCLPGYTNKNCSQEINECASNPCANNATCHDLLNAYNCTCPPGYNGTRCEVDIDWCANNPCINGGTCKDGVVSHTCTCFPGYTGRNCEVDINECLPNPCQNQGTCVERSNITAMILLGLVSRGANITFENRNGYICQCLQGTNGTNCEQNFDDCGVAPCLNNGTCHDLINDYNCTCRKGFAGKNCSVDVNECASSPCLNNATCRDEIGHFLCQCPQNFTGERCETTINPCNTVRPCRNGAKCIVDGLGYRCQCLPGFAGQNCDLSTNTNFNGRGFWDLLKSGSQIELMFRTTLSTGIVLHFLDGNGHTSVLIMEGRLFAYISRTSQTKEIRRELINDGVLHTLKVQVFPGFILYDVDNKTMNITDAFTGNVTFVVGGARLLSKPQGMELVNFTGCIQDVTFHKQVLVPSQIGNVYSSSPGNCTKTRFCSTHTCNGNGNCIDSWVAINCECRRRFFGETCGQEILPFSFAVAAEVLPTTPTNRTVLSGRRRRSITSSSEISSKFILHDSKTNFTDNSTLSFFVRTRDQSGVLTLITSGNSQTGSVTSLSFLSLQLHMGMVFVLFQHDNQKINQSRMTTLNDGQWHEIGVNKSFVTVDKAVVFTLNIRSSFPVQFLYFGGVDNATFFRSTLLSTIQFQGCVQDIVFQGKTLTNQVVPGRNTSAVNASQATTGCNGTDVCASSPCKYGGSCNDLWNAFNCTCRTGFAGRLCTRFGCAFQNTCANGTVCLDLPNMPGQTACTTSVTFNGLNQSVFVSSSTFNNTQSANVSFLLRTRRASAIILSTRSSGPTFVAIGVLAGKIYLSYQIGSGVESFTHSNPLVNDGKWHEVQIYSSGNKTGIKIDQSTVASKNQHIFGTVWHNLILADGISIGTTTHPQANATFQHFYKGCLNKLFLGQHLVHLGMATATGPKLGCISDNPCVSKPCVRGICNDTFNDYVCHCPIHYTGKQCSQTVNVTCAIIPSPCQNNASCANLSRPATPLGGVKFSDVGFDYFQCKCPRGYEGHLCQNETNECIPSPCVRGHCVDLHLNYTCICPKGFIGQNCSININDCTAGLCQNGGKCIDGIQNHTCICTDGFRGQNCSEDKNECIENNPCINNSTCTNFFGGYNCTCKNGFWGRNCQYNASLSCLSNPCKNGANCSTDSSGYRCACAAGFTGLMCETDVHECALSPCLNNGTCMDSHSNRSAPHFPGYFCSCQPQHTGMNCQSELNPCDSRPCQNNASCTKLTFDAYSCNCTKEYKGTNCEVKRTACDSDPCRNNATCIPVKNNYTCTCSIGFDGRTCETNTDPCISTPCRNGGSCTPVLQTCPPGNATCKRIYDQFNCTCAAGWLGQFCTIKNHCVPNPCKNGGSCQQTMNSTGAGALNYTCGCLSGFSGTNCETKDKDASKLGLYIGLGVGAGVLLLLIILVVCLLKDKGGMHGTYSPRKEERTGQVEMRPVEKPKPRQERLI